MITVIRKEPGKPPETVTIPNALKAMQEAVGGYIETVTVASDAVVICNEEGRILKNCLHLKRPKDPDALKMLDKATLG